jgi:hypothetical protein
MGHRVGSGTLYLTVIRLRETYRMFHVEQLTIMFVLMCTYNCI